MSNARHFAHSQKFVPSPGEIEMDGTGSLSKMEMIVSATAVATSGLAQHKRWPTSHGCSRRSPPISAFQSGCFSSCSLVT